MFAAECAVQASTVSPAARTSQCNLDGLGGERTWIHRATLICTYVRMSELKRRCCCTTTHKRVIYPSLIDEVTIFQRCWIPLWSQNLPLSGILHEVTSARGVELGGAREFCLFFSTLSKVLTLTESLHKGQLTETVVIGGL